MIKRDEKVSDLEKFLEVFNDLSNDKVEYINSQQEASYPTLRKSNINYKFELSLSKDQSPELSIYYAKADLQYIPRGNFKCIAVFNPKQPVLCRLGRISINENFLKSTKENSKFLNIIKSVYEKLYEDQSSSIQP